MHNFINAGYSPLVKAVIQYISLNLYGPLKVRDIVREFYMSESSLRSKFKKETGLNVIEYIHKRKINESKLLLRSGLAPIDVSTALNYYDYAHFQRTFKKYVGCSPKDFQRTTASISGSRSIKGNSLTFPNKHNKKHERRTHT